MSGGTPTTRRRVRRSHRCSSDDLRRADGSVYDLDEDETLERDDDDPLNDSETATRKDGRRMSAQTRRKVIRNVERVGNGIPMIAVGCLSLVFFAMASVLHVQTTEAFFLSMGGNVGLSPDWSVLNQPYLLFTGQIKQFVVVEAYMAGWLVEVAFLILTVAYDNLHRALSATSKRRAAWFRIFIYGLVLLDGYSDFQYGNIATGFVGQLFFAALMAFAVLYLGTGGYHMVMQGLGDWHESESRDD